MSYETGYAAMKRQQEDERANSPAAVAWRLRDIEIRKQAVAEREQRFPELTFENFQSAMDWQEQRIRELHAGAAWPMTNTFEFSARLEKATAIARYVANWYERLPDGDRSVDLLADLEALPQNKRDRIAKRAGERSPSESTWALVLELLRFRERNAPVSVGEA